MPHLSRPMLCNTRLSSGYCCLVSGTVYELFLKSLICCESSPKFGAPIGMFRCVSRRICLQVHQHLRLPLHLHFHCFAVSSCNGLLHTKHSHH